MHSSIVPVAVALVALTFLAGVVLFRALVVAQPDEWLLSIRNGRLVKAGVGIHLWRRPGDVVARFTSTMQRVSFTVTALSRERLCVSIAGFILWSVSADGDGPFRAFRKLGLVNLDAPPRDLKSPKHLLSTPQHRAFQQLLGAAVQRLGATRSLEELLLHQDALVTDLRRQLTALEREMGICIEQIEVLQIRPEDESLLRQMSAEVEASVHEQAASVQLATSERAKHRELESAARIAEEQAEARARELEREKEVRLAQIAQERELELAAEASAFDVAEAVLRREELGLAARLERVRREAEANRDAISAVNSAEEKKSQGVREHELARLVAEKVADAFKALPIHDARWITVGPESPAGSMAALITAARELTSGGPSGGPKKAA